MIEKQNSGEVLNELEKEPRINNSDDPGIPDMIKAQDDIGPSDKPRPPSVIIHGPIYP